MPATFTGARPSPRSRFFQYSGAFNFCSGRRCSHQCRGQSSEFRVFSLNFVLPRDYDNDAEVLIVLYLASGSPPCAIRLVPAELTRRRGRAPVGNSNTFGLSAGNQFVNFPESGNTVLKTLRLAPGGEVLDQKRGDAIMLRLARDSEHAMDTCIGATVTAIDIRYPLQ